VQNTKNQVQWHCVCMTADCTWNRKRKQVSAQSRHTASRFNRTLNLVAPFKSLQSYLTSISYPVLSVFNVKLKKAKKERLEILQCLHTSTVSILQKQNFVMRMRAVDIIEIIQKSNRTRKKNLVGMRYSAPGFLCNPSLYAYRYRNLGTLQKNPNFEGLALKLTFLYF
jgi:hypothetical protein